MIDIEEDERFVASEKTNIVSIGKWTYYQNTHLKNAPAWACYFGKHYCCTIYDTDLGYRYVVKEGDWLKEGAYKIVEDYITNSFEHSQSMCEPYLDLD